VNRWLPYQALVCRLWARSAFYQSGGAYGFRDQLQDCLLVMHYEPQLARAQLVRAAGRQFEKGDVQHWWHPPSGRGVRTHFSDDRLWLPFVLLAYLERTGDVSLLDEAVSFIAGPEPAPGHEDAHYQPETLERTASVYEHAALTLDASLEVGAHGAPLIGCGDWNDGMNRIGKEGRGESVWLGWFHSVVMRRFAALALERGDTSRARTWEEHARAVVRSIEREAWDGAWYRRAWFDDGTPLGTAAGVECRIDAIAQSWAVFSGMGDRQRARLAMDSLDQHLIQPETGILLLLAPPFDRMPQDPGYIKGYPPGLRENGGQYTHAAVWTAMAASQIGEHTRAVDYLAAINPVHRSSSRRGAVRYRIEPYVLAGDVYSTAPHEGRGGWSWYTGAAAWYWRAVIESVLGVELRAESFSVTPRVPLGWERCSLRFEVPVGAAERDARSARYQVNYTRLRVGAAPEAWLDGEPVDPQNVPLLADGSEHVLEIRLPAAD
jgi:cyclic beta-1,2-glucan synthetase